MRFLSRLRSVLLGGVLAVALITPTRASDVSLSSTDWQRLEAGQSVVREDTVERGGRRYVGGAAYILIDAAPEDVAEALEDVRSYDHILPRTRSVRWIGMSRHGESLVEIDQGTSLAHGRYTVRVRRDQLSDDGGTIRFWLDHHFSHDIADASGFFRVDRTRDGRTLLTYVVMVDLGSGLFQRLFEEKVRTVALSTPTLVKNYVEAL